MSCDYDAIYLQSMECQVSHNPMLLKRVVLGVPLKKVLSKKRMTLGRVPPLCQGPEEKLLA